MNGSSSSALRENLTLLVRPGEVVSHDWLRWPAFALAGLLGLGALYYWWSRHRPTQQSRDAPGEAPGTVALRELAQWDALQDSGRFRAAVASISGTVRRYMVGRFGLRAPVLTTDEFWRHLRAGRQIPEQFDQVLDAFLSESDGIKYAGRQPTPKQFGALLISAREFVLATADSKGSQAVPTKTRASSEGGDRPPRGSVDFNGRKVLAARPVDTATAPRQSDRFRP